MSMTTIDKIIYMVSTIQDKIATMADDKLAPLARKILGDEAVKDCQIIMVMLKELDAETEQEEDEEDED